MTPQQAREQAAKFGQLSRDVNECLKSLMTAASTSGSQFEQGKRHAGEIMGQLFCCILDPIWRRYPVLEPAEMDEPRPPDAPIDRTIAERFIRILDKIEDGVAPYSALVSTSGEGRLADSWDEPAIRQAVQGFREFIGKSYPELLTKPRAV